MMSERLKAWFVHLFTASGILTVFMALVETSKLEFRSAMFWLIAALVIDGIDGTFARRYNVKEVLPHMDGKYIDYVIDFAGYAIIPAFMIYKASLMPETTALILALIIVFTSAVYYGKSSMVSEDASYFMGFPVLWNLVAFFLIFVFSFSAILNIIFILFFAALQFAPIKFAYPSVTKRWMPASITFTIIFLISGVGLLLTYPGRPLILYWGAIISILYFAVFAIAATFVFDD